MSKWKVFHNPKCSKSRQALAFLEDQGIEAEVVEYLKNPPSQSEIKRIIKQSSQSPSAFIRKKEPELKDFSSIDFENIDEVAAAIHQVPKIMERPIVMNGSKVVIARPTELIEGIL